MSAAQRRPPAFQIEIGPQPLLQGLIALLAAIAVLCLVAALAAHVPPLWWLALAVPLAGALAWHLSRIEPRHLLWDSQTWRLAATLHEQGAAVEVDVVMDLGAWLLLRAQVQGTRLPQRHYLPLARQALGASWGQLRATLYSARSDTAST